MGRPGYQRVGGGNIFTVIFTVIFAAIFTAIFTVIFTVKIYHMKQFTATLIVNEARNSIHMYIRGSLMTSQLRRHKVISHEPM